MTPDWTPERLDEYGKSRGRALAWARRAKQGEFVGDPFESLDFPLSFRFYSIFSAFLIAFAFGRSTPNLLSQLDVSPGAADLLQHDVTAMAIELFLRQTHARAARNCVDDKGFSGAFK